jgi:uncharacterized protein
LSPQPHLTASRRAATCGMVLLLALVSQAPALADTPPPPLAGAYRAVDGRVVSILPAGAPGHWRITHFDSGRSHRLHPADTLNHRSARDWESAEPAAIRYRFALDGAGAAVSLSISEDGLRPLAMKRLALRESPASFKSGDVDLCGRLTLPASGRAPFRTVVFVHGSDPVPSVGQELLPHLAGAHGIATLVFDKRGTGCSKGQYVQHFGVLSDDVVAAVQWLKTVKEVDAGRIGLVGFSQGGWVAPLAALKEPAIRFVAVGYGLAMSMADEDRLEAPLKLRAAGVDEASVAEFEQLNAALHRVAREGFQDWREFEALAERFRERPWLATARQQQSWVSVVFQMGIAQAKVAAPGMFQHFFQPFYEPVPTLEKLGVPMLWLIAGDDIEAPPGPTLEVLARLRREGKPVTTVVFPGADHGLHLFELRQGKRIRTQYAPRSFSTLLSWLRDPK